eukprot:g3508.t1
MVSREGMDHFLAKPSPDVFKYLTLSGVSGYKADAYKERHNFYDLSEESKVQGRKPNSLQKVAAQTNSVSLSTNDDVMVHFPGEKSVIEPGDKGDGETTPSLISSETDVDLHSVEPPPIPPEIETSPLTEHLDSSLSECVDDKDKKGTNPIAGDFLPLSTSQILEKLDEEVQGLTMQENEVKTSKQLTAEEFENILVQLETQLDFELKLGSSQLERRGHSASEDEEADSDLLNRPIEDLHSISDVAKMWKAFNHSKNETSSLEKFHSRLESAGLIEIFAQCAEPSSIDPRMNLQGLKKALDILSVHKHSWGAATKQKPQNNSLPSLLDTVKQVCTTPESISFTDFVNIYELYEKQLM